MRIAVNARFLLKNRLEGLGRFSDEVLKRMVREHPEHEFVFFFDRKWDPSFIYEENVRPVHVFPQARHPYLYTIWFQLALPLEFKRWKPDVFFSPDGFLSLPASLAQVPVIHDLAFEHFPEFVSKTGARFYRKNFPKFANKATRIATVSEFSKSDIHRMYGIAESKIDVVFNGVSAAFKRTEKTSLDRFRVEKMQGKPWFVYIGALHPRKNIGRMLEAFDSFKKTDTLNYQLVVIGRKAWQTSELEEAFHSMIHQDSVHFTGRITDEEMIPFLSGARSLLYVPVFEGFGLPLLEAFQCGVPAITSNVSSLPEVAGEAAICVDPFSTDSISHALQKMANNDSLHDNLSIKAENRARHFSWDKTAQLTWQCIEKAIFDRA
ncbi:MAG: glycosyltransferase [Bacteroidetes bacterium]|nr:glycosyltransferase [Bacteroidota bacterium]